ncbi:MAG TPA: helix-turn-helix domain-containing protein [Candidatus Limnocylindria bacterium]
MPKLWNATIATHRAAVRDAILDATVTLVAERGLRGVTMAEVAAGAGIGRATLYKYFGDAEAILRAWHEREIGRHLAEVGAIAEGPGAPAEQLAAALERYAVNAQAGRGGHDAELAAVLHRDEHVAAARHRLRRLLAGLIAAAAATGSVRDDVAPDELAAYALHALGAARELRSRGAVRRLVALTLAGLRP